MKLAGQLRERSKRDNEIIVGSEIRAALDEQQSRIDMLEDTLRRASRMFRAALEEE